MVIPTKNDTNNISVKRWLYFGFSKRITEQFPQFLNGTAAVITQKKNY